MFVKLDETRALSRAFVQIYLQLLKRTSGQVRIMFLFNLISLITNQMVQFIKLNELNERGKNTVLVAHALQHKGVGEYCSLYHFI